MTATTDTTASQAQDKAGAEVKTYINSTFWMHPGWQALQEKKGKKRQINKRKYRKEMR